QGDVVPATDAGCDEGLVRRLAARESHVAVDTRQLARAVGRRELGQQTLHRRTTGAFVRLLVRLKPFAVVVRGEPFEEGERLAWNPDESSGEQNVHSTLECRRLLARRSPARDGLDANQRARIRVGDHIQQTVRSLSNVADALMQLGEQRLTSGPLPLLV